MYLCLVDVVKLIYRKINDLFFISYYMNINKTISKLYNNATLMERYGGEVYITILILFIFGVAFTYINVLNHVSSIKKNWGHERCNPFIIPLAGWINNPNKKTESDFQYTVDNFEFCLGSVVQSVFQFIADAFKFILQGIASLFQDILNILSGIINFIMSIISAILGLLQNAWGLALQGSVGLQETLNKSRDTFGRLVGFVVVVLYTKMLLFRMSIAWMITTPIFMLFSLVVQLLVELLLKCIKNQAITIYMWGKFAYCVMTTNTENAMEDNSEAMAASGTAETADAAADNISGETSEGLGASLAADPFTAAAAPAAFAAGVMMFIQAVGAAVAAMISFASGVVSAISAAISGAYVAMSCSMSIMSAVMTVFRLVFMAIQIAAAIVLIYLMFLCVQFGKVTLGQMNIPGQGIPGLSF
jgi:hypothetical protein